MNWFQTRKSVWIPCAAAAAAPWIALIFHYSAVLLIAAIVVTAAAVAAVVWTFCADRAQAAQAELYWYALAPELPDPPPQSPADWLTQLGQRAAAQAEAADAERRTTAQFLSGWRAQVTDAVTELCSIAARVQQTQPAEGRLLTQECNTLRCRAAQLMEYFHCESDCTLRCIQPVELSRVLSDAILHHSEELRARRIGLRRSMTRLRTASDPVLLTAVLDELLDNAIRHTPAGGAIGLTCRLVNGCAEIAVEDAGCGIPPEELSRIFTRGFVGRGEDPGRAGLGLFTARAYCTLLGHSLSVTSAEGKGTRAVIRVACTDAP